MQRFNTVPLDIIDLPADMFHYGVSDKLVPKFIVIHATAGKDSRRWLTTTSNPPVSVHRLITRTGDIYKIVDDTHVAWHVGHAILFPGPDGKLTNLNNLALGIELENLNDGKEKYTPQQVDSTARQVIEWYGKYGYLPILSHASVDARKSDPAGFDFTLLAYRVARGLTRLIG